MNNFQLSLGRKRIRFGGPASWAELSNHQRVGLMRFRSVVSRQGGDYLPSEIFPVLTLLYGLKPRLMRYFFDEWFLRRQGYDAPTVSHALELGQQLLDTLSWIGQDDEQATFPNGFRRLDHHYGSVRVLCQRCWHVAFFEGPGDGLDTSTFAEFMLAERAYRTRNIPLLAAVLYRPRAKGAKPGADRRTPLDLNDVDSRAQQLQALDPALLEAIALGFSHTMLLLQRMFTHLFPRQLPASSAKAGSWFDLAINMAKLDATKMQQIEQLNLYLALKVLDEQMRQAQELEAEIEKYKKK